MPISGTSTDYSTRTKDLHIFQGVSATKLATITPSFGKISNYCAGIQKLIQRYAISLLNELGSQENYPGFGTTLIQDLLRSNSSINRADVYPIFNKANLKVIQEFRAYQRLHIDLPVDEQLATAGLTDISIVNDTASLKIEIIPMTTEPVILLLPLPKS